MMGIIQSATGLAVLIAVCAFFSSNRIAIRPSLLVKGLLLQIIFALLLLKLPTTQFFFEFLNRGLELLQQSTAAGTTFVFGYLGGAELPYDEIRPGASYILAYQTLPLVIVISVLSALLIYWRVLPLIMRGCSYLLERTLGVGGAVGLAIASNAFLGMVEAPLLIRPYLSKLTNSELFAVMMAGMATIAGTMLVIEAAVISDVVPNATGHLISASLITLPGVVYISHLLEPNTSDPTSSDKAIGRGGDSVIDVITKGTQMGLNLFLTIIAMVLVIVSLVHLLNALLNLLPDIFGAPVSLERILGYLLAPLTWLMGIPWSEAVQAGQLMGTKTILTEFIAYIRLGEIPADALSPRSRIIMTYALCGFANFVSLGIMIAGLVTMVPARRDEIFSFGMKAIVGGTVATCTTACLIAILL